MAFHEHEVYTALHRPTQGGLGAGRKNYASKGVAMRESELWGWGNNPARKQRLQETQLIKTQTEPQATPSEFYQDIAPC